MAKFNLPFANAGEHRYPTPDEQAQGFPCGPVDRDLFNGMFNRLESELGNTIAYSGQTGTDNDMSQVSKAVQSGKLSYAVADGGTNALTVTLNPAPTTYPKMLAVGFKATNTGNMTIKVNNLAVVPLVYGDGSNILAGEIYDSRVGYLVFDGAKYILTNPILYFARMTPKNAMSASVYQSNVVLGDLPPNDLVRAISVMITGATYIDAIGSVVLQNASAQLVAVTARLNLVDVGAPTYSGGFISNGIGITIPTPGRWQGLDPEATYTLEILVQKSGAIGPVLVYDPQIMAYYG